MSHLNLIHPSPRQLAGYVEAQLDAEQAAADDAALAREERNEQIEDSVSFDRYDVTPEAGAVIVPRCAPAVSKTSMRCSTRCWPPARRP
ncbi:hypothetical protein [Burkholderia gladioli]|uniref:hypothetical protein n=1 Tax=Burkholderia gladioli TaxID=28095 RepID=UPI003D2293EB